MKVYVDCRWYSQPGQGVVSYLSGLHLEAERLKRLTGRADLEFWYAVDSLEKIDNRLIPAGANILEIGSRSLLWRLFILPFKLHRLGFSVAHFQYICPLFSFGTKYITTIHDVIFLERSNLFSWHHVLSRYLLYKVSALNSEIVLTVSERSRDNIRKLLGVNRRVEVIYNGSGIALSRVPRSVERLQGKKFLLTVGRVEPRKNYPRLIDAFSQERLSQEVLLVVVGFCDDEFSDQRRRLIGNPSVIWLESVTDEELSWLYISAVGFIYPSIAEGFGIPVLEAMKVNVPLAITSTFPLFDVLASVPYRFDPESVDDIRRAISSLINYPRTIPDALVDAILNKYSWENSAEKYISLIQDIS